MEKVIQFWDEKENEFGGAALQADIWLKENSDNIEIVGRFVDFAAASGSDTRTTVVPMFRCFITIFYKEKT